MQRNSAVEYRVDMDPHVEHIVNKVHLLEVVYKKNQSGLENGARSAGKEGSCSLSLKGS